MIELSQSDKNKLHTKVLNEYWRAKLHTDTWKQDVKDLWRDYLLPKPWQDKVKIRKVHNNLTIRLATFVSDDIQVTNIPMDWVLGKDMAKNCDKVFEANFDSMKIKQKYREAIIDDALQGVWVLAVDWWNEHKQEPIVSYIDSRLCFPDPKNWQDNTMSFFGTKVRKSWYELMEDVAYDQEALKRCKAYVDSDQKEVDRTNNYIKGFNEDLQWDENQTDLYNHITVFKAEWDDKPCVYLLTYWCGQTELVRVVKMRALTPWEIADPSTIDFGVKLFRAKPIKGSFAGTSLIDDVWQFQDIETLLANLQIHKAKLESLGGKTYVNTALWVDFDDVQNQTWPWDIIPYTSTNPAINAQNGIMQEQTMPVNPILQNTIQYIDSLSQEADPSGSAIAQWQTQSGTQTKAEIQTLQQNINKVLSYMASNYMDSIKWLWESIYRSYAANMSSQKKKNIVVVDEWGNTDSYGFKKREFISDGDVYIRVKSKAQEAIRKKQDFAIMLSLDGSVSQIFAPWSTQISKWKRHLLNNSGIKWLDGEQFFYYTQDERIAYSNLEILNRNEELKTKPQPWEDHNARLQIYKTGLDTDARNKAIEELEAILMAEPKQQEQAPAGQWWAATQLGASMLASDNAQRTPSIADVSA